MIRRGYRPAKIAFLAWHAWRDADAGDWPPGFPDDRRTAYDLAAVRGWLVVFVKRFFASQFKRSALPERPEGVARAAPCRPAATGGCRPTPPRRAWLAEIERDLPT